MATPSNQQLAAQIVALQSQLNALTKKEASDIAALQSQIGTLQTAVAGLAAPSAPTRVPAAVAGMGWAQKANWDFGANAGNNVQKLSDFLGSGWSTDTGSWGVETAATLTGDTDPHFQMQSDHVELVDIYTGGTPAQNNGSITAPVFVTHADLFGMTREGYYEATLKIPGILGVWPAWWMIGWNPSAGQPTWGPEIDIIEEFGQTDDGPTKIFSTLHAPANPSFCFLPTPGTVEGTTEVPITELGAHATPTNWAAGGFVYSPGTDFSQAFHTYGAKINADGSIEIWIDDVLIGKFEAKQFCTDTGTPIVPRPIIDFAVQGATYNLADFGGVNVSDATNKYRYGIKNIQFWG